MQHEAEPFGGRCALVLEDHPPIRVLRPLADVLATHECEAHRARIAVRGCGQRAADAAARAAVVGEAIPVLARRLQSADQHAAGPVRCKADGRRRRGDDAVKPLVLRDFTVSDAEVLPSANGRRVQRMTLSACGSPDATPSGYNSRRSVHAMREFRARACSPGRRGAEGSCIRQEFTPAEVAHGCSRCSALHHARTNNQLKRLGLTAWLE